MNNYNDFDNFGNNQNNFNNDFNNDFNNFDNDRYSNMNNNYNNYNQNNNLNNIQSGINRLSAQKARENKLRELELQYKAGLITKQELKYELDYLKEMDKRNNTIAAVISIIALIVVAIVLFNMNNNF